MGQVTLPIVEAFGRGLTPNSRTVTNAEYFKTCYGVLVRGDRLQACETFHFPAALVMATVPHIELFELNGLKGFVRKDDTTITLYHFSANLAAEVHEDVEFAVAGRPHFAITSQGAFVTNGLSIMFIGAGINPGDGVPFDSYWVAEVGEGSVPAAVPTTVWDGEGAVGVRSVCTYGDRVIFAGIDKTVGLWGSTGEFEELLTLLRKYSPAFQSGALLHDTADSIVIYSRPGGGTHTHPYSLERCLLSGWHYSEIGEILKDAIRRREIGVCEPPFTGTIVAAKQLGQRLVLYGESGVATATLKEYGMMDVPLLKDGVYNRGTVDGDNHVHCWVAPNEKVWLFDEDAAPKELDYAEHLHTGLAACTRAGTTFRVLFDGRMRDFYFVSDDVPSAHVLTDERGFSRSIYIPWAIAIWGEKSYSYLQTEAETDFELILHVRDEKRRSFKSIDAVELLHRGAVGVRMNLILDGKSTLQKQIDRLGYAFFKNRAVDYEVRVTGEMTPTTTLFGMRVKWRDTDFRNIRGMLETPQNES